MRIIIRPFNKETDTGLILDSWPKNAYHSASHPTEEGKGDWFAEMYAHAQAKLAGGMIRIACSDEEPNLIAGYAVIDGECLEFVWVKPRYREIGVAHLLLSRDPITHFNPVSLTERGEKLVTNLGLKEKR